MLLGILLPSCLLVAYEMWDFFSLAAYLPAVMFAITKYGFTFIFVDSMIGTITWSYR